MPFRYEIKAPHKLARSTSRSPVTKSLPVRLTPRRSWCRYRSSSCYSLSMQCTYNILNDCCMEFLPRSHKALK